MRLEIYAIGRLKSGPERDLAERYTDRLSKAGPAVGLSFGGVTEFAESRARSASERWREEAGVIGTALGTPAALVLLDERGVHLSSEDFAGRIGRMRDEGKRNCAFVIGGPDGHDPELRGKADLLISFGRMTWPHQIARVLLAEQLYRAVTILSGHPYHRA